MMHEDVIFCFCVKKSLLNYLQEPKNVNDFYPKSKKLDALDFCPPNTL